MHLQKILASLLVGVGVWFAAPAELSVKGASPEAAEGVPSEPEDGGSSSESLNPSKPEDVVPRFADAVTKTEYPAADPPDKPPLLRWDFSEKVNHQYDYDARLVAGMRWLTSVNSRIDIEARLALRSEGDKTATMFVDDMAVRTELTSGSEEEPTVKETAVRPVRVRGVTEEGKGPFEKVDEMYGLETLFPLPSKRLKVGESDRVPCRTFVEFKTGADKTTVRVRGHRCITLTRYVMVGDRRCAQLDVQTQLSDVEVPQQLEGRIEYAETGVSRFYFDVDGRRFVNGCVARSVRSKVLLGGRGGAPGEDRAKADGPFSVPVTATGEGLVRVGLPSETDGSFPRGERPCEIENAGQEKSP